jgi:hypothetical protein
MGAWSFAKSRLNEIISGRWPLRYIGRIQNSSPAEGSSAWHAVNQQAIIRQTLVLQAEDGGENREEEEIIQEGSLVARD